jgi:ankyrin repeat protein
VLYSWFFKPYKAMKKIVVTLVVTVVTQFSVLAQDIFQSARANDVATIEKVVAAGVDVNQANDRGFTPLILAVYNESYDAAQWLINNGANVNAQDKSGNTALMGAIFKGYPKMASLLIPKADINQQNFSGATALIFAATFGQEAIAKELLANKADKAIKDQSGKTALDHATLQENEALKAVLQ